MGICSSCLGSKSWNDGEEESRLINSDEPNYGSHVNGNFYPEQMNEQNDHQREREQLDRIVAETSDNLIDIFSLHTTPGQYADTSRLQRYRLQLQRISPPTPIQMPEILPKECITAEEREMMEIVGKMAEEAMCDLKRIKNVGSLVVQLDVDN